MNADIDVGQEESDFSWRKMRIAIVALIGSFLGSSLLPYGALMFAMLPMTQEFNWTRAEFSWATTAMLWTTAITLPLVGRWTDRLGVRPVILLGVVPLGLVTLALAHIGPNPWVFWILFAALGAAGASSLAYTKVITALFSKHRGKALAIIGAESAIVMAVSPLITNYLIANFGWRGVFSIYGTVILATAPFVFFLLPEPGAAPGQSVWRRGPLKTALSRETQVELPGMTTHDALRDWTFWALLIAGICSLAPLAGLVNHLVAAVVEKGFSQTTAANASAIGMIFCVFWILLSGYLVDKVPSAKVSVPFQLLPAVGVFLFSIVTDSFGGVPLLFVAFNLVMLGLMCGPAMTSYFQSRFFGFRNFGEIIALQKAPLTISMGLSAPAVGWIYDSTKSYQTAFMVAIIGLLIAAGLFMTLGRYRYAVNPSGPGPMIGTEAGSPKTRLDAGTDIAFASPKKDT